MGAATPTQVLMRLTTLKPLSCAALVVVVVANAPTYAMSEKKMLSQVYYCQDAEARARGLKFGAGVWAYDPKTLKSSPVGNILSNDGISIFTRAANTGWVLTCVKPPLPPKGVTVSGPSLMYESCRSDEVIYDCLVKRFLWKMEIGADGKATLSPPAR